MNANVVETSALVRVLARKGVPSKGFLKKEYNTRIQEYNKEAISGGQNRIKGSVALTPTPGLAMKESQYHPKAWKGGGGRQCYSWMQVENWSCGRGYAQEEL